jgi:hypothetical protein
MTLKTNDTWGQIIATPPVYYTTTDASALAVSQTKEAINLAIGAWGNYGPVEVNIIGSSVNAALQLEAEYSARHEALDPKWSSEWDSPSTDPSSGYHIFTQYAESTNAAVSSFRRDYLSHDFFMLTMGTNHVEIVEGATFPFVEGDWIATFSEDYQRIVMHEYWHVYQHAHVMDLSPSDNRDVNPRDEKLGTQYMTEGGANYMALQLYNSTHDMRDDYVLTEMEKYLTSNNALERYKTKGVLLQNITKSDPDSDLYYSIGAWFVAYLESKHSAEDYSVNFYDDLNSLGFEAAFVKNYGKSSTDYLAEFEIFINQPMDEILKIIPSTSTTDAATGEVNVVVTTLGDLGADTIRGTKGNDLLNGNGGNDTIFADGGSDTINGGTGLDMIRYTLTQANYTLALGESSSTIQEISTGTNDIFSSIERIVFSDKAVALDIGSGEIGGSSYRIYKAAFNRTPDEGGLGYWIGQMDLGMDLVDVSARFIDSDEFRAAYGTNPSNGEFLTKVYNNVLSRDPDSGGYDWWVDQLANNPEKSWDKVLADFSESTENQANVLELIGNGVQYDLWVD